MKIIRRKVDNAVMHLVEDGVFVEIRASHAVVGRKRVIDINPADYELVSGVSPPSRPFVATKMVYDGDWSVPDESAYVAHTRVPSSVPRAYARIACEQEGVWSLIEPAIAAMAEGPDKVTAMALFYDAARWFCADPVLDYLCGQLGITPARKAQLFRIAASKMNAEFGGG